PAPPQLRRRGARGRDPAGVARLLVDARAHGDPARARARAPHPPRGGGLADDRRDGARRAVTARQRAAPPGGLGPSGSASGPAPSWTSTGCASGVTPSRGSSSGHAWTAVSASWTEPLSRTRAKADCPVPGTLHHA